MLDLGTLTAKLTTDNSGLERGLDKAEGKMHGFGLRAGAAMADDFDTAGERSSGNFISRMGAGLPALGPALMPILATVGIAGGGVLAAGLAAAVIAAVPLLLGGGVLAAGIMVAAKDPAVAAAFAPLKEQGAKVLKDFAEPFKGPLIRAAKTFGDALARIAPYLTQMGVAMAPIIDKFAPVLADMAVRAMPGILHGVQASVPMFVALAGALARADVGGWISGVVSGIVSLLPYAAAAGAAFVAVGKFLGGVLIPPIRSLVGQYLGALRDGVGGVTQAYRENQPQIATLVRWVTLAAKWIGSHLAPAFGRLLVANIRGAVAAVRIIIATVSAFVRGVQAGVSAIRSAVQRIREIVGWLRTWFGQAKDAAVGKMGDLVSWLRGLGGRIKGAVGNLGSVLVSAGRSIIDGLISGIRAGFDRVRSTLGELTGMLPDWKGPAQRDAGILKPAGRLVMQGFSQGLEERFAGIKTGLGRFTDDLALKAIPAQRASAPALAGRTAQQQIVVRFEGGSDPWTRAMRQTARVVGKGDVQVAYGNNSTPVRVMGG